MDLKFEVVVIPVSDVDRAKEFYEKALGFRVDVDHRAAVYEEALGFRHRGAASYRIVQLTPPGFGMLDPDRHGDHAGDAGRIPGDVPDHVRHRGHAG